MSIIVFKDGIVVADGRCSNSVSIINDNYTKMVKFGPDLDKYFFFVGSPCWIEFFTDHYLSGVIIPEIRREILISGIVIENDQINHCWIDSNEGEIIREDISSERFYAIGSGQDHAFTALDMGASALEAVKMAVKRDFSCGGTLRQWSIDITSDPLKYGLSAPILYHPQYQIVEPEDLSNE